METILLFGNAHDHTLRNMLLPTLERYGGVLYAGERQIFRLTSEKPAFFVYDCERLPDLLVDRGILLFKSSCPRNGDVSIPSGVCSVVESFNQNAIHFLQSVSSPVITYGTSAKDTLSAASLEYGRAVLSLQRSIVCLNGTLLEPHDFHVDITGGEPAREILPISLVLLLCGTDSGNGYII